jgi:hypothetical protein
VRRRPRRRRCSPEPQCTELDQSELRKQVCAISASGLEDVGVAVPTAALAISAFSAISATRVPAWRFPRFPRFRRTDTKPRRDSSRGFPQFPQAICQSRGPARAGRCQDLVIPAISASDMPMAGGLAWQRRGFPQFPQAICQSRGPARAGRCQDLGIPAISASDMPMASGLAWQARDGKLREHASWRPGILSHRIGVRKSTSGPAACSVTERWRCGRLSRRASMMPILSRWDSADIRHNIAQERQG